MLAKEEDEEPAEDAEEEETEEGRLVDSIGIDIDPDSFAGNGAGDTAPEQAIPAKATKTKINFMLFNTESSSHRKLSQSLRPSNFHSNKI